ncbi:hypothetical protein CIRMBP1284_00040 [Enterococcus cecorum]|uniref:DUF3267 domain-containing protein n=1 Tax=Enterococcus cecorum TaxID=44008 RepID=UPI0022D96FF4|nr:DUF3267 domain-containing protein [Enterococcus cecorum]CAI3252192.1 hypothetical protein CIRMBP1266_00040 [Enterococcus cecorum]CAI3252394.1 hypothetical protein CIRMBP1270_00040 [Enterococcus cecorum]CAI3252413.1 hypothetical protein CIRMBP1244_00040 [Enterococcus cecorum]CAI3252423.1 hypothetical protein CIRMBP1245_00040 [Enterococcus cecorum]CAI3253240.1 hypothetical protein CIRMBP1251_00040 [Enterococcus cecorum]
MFQIHYMGKYKDESQLIKNQPYPYQATQFKESDNLNKIFLQGLLIGLPLFIVMFAAGIYRIFSIDYQWVWNFHWLTVGIVYFFLMYPLMIIHEVIHALCFPIQARKEIWNYLEQGAMFVYCEEKVGKLRFILMSLAPALVLGILPFLIWYVVAPYLSIEASVCWVLMSFTMALSAVGDFVNVYHAIRQVPKHAKIFNYGFHSFWIKEE